MRNRDNLSVDDLIDLESHVLSGSLSLSSFELKEIPPKIFQLKHLRDLNLSNNKISTVSDEIENLTNLCSLSLANNLITQLPEEICSLHNLENLDVGLNRLNYLPTDLPQLVNLSYLRIGSNSFHEVPASVSKLRALKFLIADNLELESFPISVTLSPMLQTLNLAGNAFTRIPNEFVKMESLKRLVVDGDKISNIPLEILERSPGAIVNYLHAFEKMGETIKLQEAKLILVGEGAVGKTALMNRLVDDVFDETTNTTLGIGIKNWSLKKNDESQFTLNVWDFGGQEIYHSTHQFFLTKRSLYLFIWDARKEDNILNFEYWMNVVSLLSERSPIICVQNKIDERMTTIDEDAIVKKFPNVRSFQNVSAATGNGVPNLRGEILSEVEKLEHIGDILPASWNKVRGRLASLKKKYIYKDRYLKICETEGIDHKSATYLSQYYHDLGVFLHFSDNKILEQIVFLDPEWATGAVYRLIDTKEVQNNFGKFAHEDLKRYWSKFSGRNHIYLIELMKKFELCFEIAESEEYIIPELLSHRRPAISSSKNPLRFEYHYDFMPAGIVSRFIVRCNDLIKGNQFWRTGVVLQREDTRAIVVSEPLRRKLKIEISGSNKSHLLAIIRRELAAIHKSLNNPHALEMLPCPCSTCRKSKKEYYHSFEYLKRAKAKRKYYVECKHSLDDVAIEDIMEGIKRNNLVDFNVNYEGNIPDTILVGEVLLSTVIDKKKLSHLGVSFEDYTRFVGDVARLNEGKLLELEKLLRANSVFERKKKSNKVTNFAKNNGIGVAQGLAGNALFELLAGIFM